MTEFISRKYGNEGYEVIIKTTDHEHYRATEEFARRLIDHTKPMTNGDRIRAMTDREIAEWLSCPAVVEGKRCFYPGPREKMCLDCCFDWLREPVKEDAE